MRRPPLSRLATALALAAMTLVVLPQGALAAAPTGKRAESARGTAVVDLSQDEKENAELMLDVRGGVALHTNKKGDLDFVLTDVNSSLNAGGEQKDRTNIATARGFASAGQAAHDKKEWADAADQYESARKLYEESLAGTDDPSGTYGPLVVRLGEAQLLAGDSKAAREAFIQGAFWGARVSDLDPKAEAAYELAQRDVAKLPLGIVEVNTDPAYAEVFVDGKFQGVSPVRVIDVAQGTHIVTVSKPGYERGTARLDVVGEKTAHKDLKLDEARRRLIFEQLKPKLEREIVAATTPGSKKWGMGGDAIVELGSLFRTEIVVLTKVTGPPETKTLELYVFHVPSQRLVASSKTDKLDWSYRNSDAVHAAVGKTLDIDWVTKLGGEVAGPVVESESVTSKWWFWTLIGVAVAGGATAVVLATSGSDEPPPFDKTDGTGAIVIGF